MVYKRVTIKLKMLKILYFTLVNDNFNNLNIF